MTPDRGPDLAASLLEYVGLELIEQGIPDIEEELGPLDRCFFELGRGSLNASEKLGRQQVREGDVDLIAGAAWPEAVQIVRQVGRPVHGDGEIELVRQDPGEGDQPFEVGGRFRRWQRRVADLPSHPSPAFGDPQEFQRTGGIIGSATMEDYGLSTMTRVEADDQELTVLLEAARRATWDALCGPRYLRSGRFHPRLDDSQVRSGSAAPARAPDEDDAPDSAPQRG